MLTPEQQVVTEQARHWLDRNAHDLEYGTQVSPTPACRWAWRAVTLTALIVACWTLTAVLVLWVIAR